MGGDLLAREDGREDLSQTHAADGSLAGGVAGWGADAGAPRRPWQVSAKASLACLEGCGCIPGAKVIQHPKSAGALAWWQGECLSHSGLSR